MTNLNENLVELRSPNWLPLPFDVVAARPAAQVVDETDLFSKGDVVSFYPLQGYGHIKNARGEEIVFHIGELYFTGPKAGPEHIAVGTRVGFDISHTSHGPHVSRLKIY